MSRVRQGFVLRLSHRNINFYCYESNEYFFLSGSYIGLCQTYRMKPFCKNSQRVLLFVFAKGRITHSWQGLKSLLNKYGVIFRLLFIKLFDLCYVLTLPVLDDKKKLNLYFKTSFWCRKRFSEGLKGLHKTFWGTKKKWK